MRSPHHCPANDRAIADHDAETLTTVFAASPLHVGIPRQVWEPLREKARRAVFATDLERLDVLAAAEAELTGSGQRLIGIMGQLIDFEVAKAAPQDLDAARKAEAAVAEERARLEHERRHALGQEGAQPILPSKAERKRKGPWSSGAPERQLMGSSWPVPTCRSGGAGRLFLQPYEVCAMSLTGSERRHLIDLFSERPARDCSELILALVEANPTSAAVVTRLLQAGGLHASISATPTRSRSFLADSNGARLRIEQLTSRIASASMGEWRVGSPQGRSGHHVLNRAQRSVPMWKHSKA